MKHRVALKRGLLSALATAGYVCLLPLWRRLRTRRPGGELRILNYHSISDSRPDDTNVTPDAFRRHCQQFNRTAHVMDLHVALEEMDRHGSWPDGSICITFDDGYADNLRSAMPILKEHGLTATCYLTTDYMDSNQTLPHDEAYPYDACRLLSWIEVRELRAEGMSMGSHAMAHVHLSHLNSAAKKEQIAISKRRIEEHLDQPVDTIAFPYGRYGDYDDECAAFAKQAGYRASATAKYGWNTRTTNRYELRRIGIDASDTFFTLRAKLNGALDMLVLLEYPFLRSCVRRINARIS